MEKFIDHTDIGMNQPSTCRSCETDRDAGECEYERDTGRDEHAERDEQQDQRGEATHELGLVEGFGVDLVEVAPHGPFTRDLGPRSGRELQLVDVGAERTGCDRTFGILVDDLVDGNERGVTVGRDEPRGGRQGQRVRDRPCTRRTLQLGDELRERRRICRDRSRLVIHDDGIFGAERGKVAADLVAHDLRG